ncbi:MAG: ribonuclease III [Bacteroidales bacterium]|nr:ribonuclease III [Bacteroidales bacterium]MDY2704840.1 ribonuclease III [Alloprevotella sp.]
MLSNLLDRIKLHFQKDSELRKALHSMLGFYPRNLEIYRIALAHKSHVYRNRKGRSFNNERLEFLGDAILEAVVSDIVFHRFERRSEGFLTSTRSKIVQRSSLNRLAKEIGLERLLQVPSQRRGHNSNIGGNAFEALVGAIYLDRGYKTCQWFVENKIVGCLLDIENVANKEVNFKSKLLEWTQKNRVQVDFENEEALDEKNDSPLFNSTILLEGLTAGEGRGYSKKESQQRASRDALTRLRRDPLFVESIFDEKSKRISMEATLIYAPPVIEEIEEALREEAQQAERAKRKEQARREEKPRSRKAAPKADAPKKEADAPALAKADAPKKEADAPKKEVTKQAKPAPAKEKPAPAKEKPAPAKAKPAPAKEKPAPAEEKAKQETEQPSEIVLAPVPEQETPAPAPAPAPAAVLDVPAPAPAASAANESEEAVPAAAKKSRKAHRGSGARRNPNQPAPTPTVAPAQAPAESAPAEKEATVPAKEAAAQPKEAAAQPKEAAKPARKKVQPKAKPAAPKSETKESKSETKESKSEVKEPKSEAATETPAAPQKRARRTRKPNSAPAQPTAEELKAREAAIQAAEDAAYAE